MLHWWPAKIILAISHLLIVTTVQAAEEEIVKIKTQGKLKIESEDFSYQWKAKVQADWASFNQDLRRPELITASELRAAELEVSGTFSRIWEYTLAVDFAGNEVDVGDAFISVVPNKWVHSNIGLFGENFGFDEAMGTSSHPMMEKSLAAQVFGGDNRIGAAVNLHHWKSAMEIGAFDSPASDDGRIENRTRAFVGRISNGSFQGDWGALHLGLDLREQQHKAGARENREVSFDARPGVHVTDLKLIDTGDIEYTKKVRTWALESGIGFQSILLYGEYYRARIIPFSPAPHGKASFQGGHLTASWVVLGKAREYDDEDGSWGDVGVEEEFLNQDGLGALELAMRLDKVDLDDGTFKGGKQTNYGGGLNWFPTENIRISGNYIQVNSIRNGLRDRPRLLAFRTQFSF